MRWLKVHDPLDEPALTYREIEAGCQVRKVEIYRDGRAVHAGGSGEPVEVPAEAWAVERTEFEQIWQVATGALYARFAGHFGVTDRAGSGGPWPGGRISALIEVFGGSTFGGGLYRVHTPASAGLAAELVADAFPDHGTRLGPCFGFDWLGRQFALDLADPDAADPPVLMLEPGTGEVLEIPVPFSRLHDNELVDYADAALATDFFEVWRETGGGAPAHSQCVGYRIPLFLGGEDEVGNLEVVDWEVYWSVTGQLRTQLLQP